MTILHLINQLVGHFCVKDTFGPEDLATIKVTQDLEERKAALVQLAMKDLTESGHVAPIAADTWILRRPIPQNAIALQISLETATDIAATINDDLEARGIQDHISALEITEDHIIGLLYIINEELAQDPGQP